MDLASLRYLPEGRSITFATLTSPQTVNGFDATELHTQSSASLLRRWEAVLPTPGPAVITTEADVDFAEKTATGTITLTYWLYPFINGFKLQKKIARLTFQATRVEKS